MAKLANKTGRALANTTGCKGIIYRSSAIFAGNAKTVVLLFAGGSVVLGRANTVAFGGVVGIGFFGAAVGAGNKQTGVKILAKLAIVARFTGTTRLQIFAYYASAMRSAV